ncbi:MAG TPA: hypothetical protein VFZ91_03380 [Allosphingosinicella sp.]
MKTPLLPITIASIYEVGGVKVALPKRMAQCTPDMKKALADLAIRLADTGGKLILSDLFRSYDMQLGSHLDWKSKKKKAFSPPPGGSLHEGGRALDLDLGSLKMKLGDFWPIALEYGLVPIIDKPVAGASEAWHFECRGSHMRVYDYYKAGNGTNFDKPYQAMAASAIVSVGVKVDKFGTGQDIAYLQSGLIRLGHSIGNLDGASGPKTRAGLEAVGIEGLPVARMIEAMDIALQKEFPEEFFDKSSGEAGLPFQ